MSKQSDLAFTGALRDLLQLEDGADLEFVFNPDVRTRRPGRWPAWLYRPMSPLEKRKVVLNYIAGETARNIARRFNRSRTTVANLLKAVKIYLSPLERDPQKIEAWRARVSEFLATGEIERWHAEWSAQWRRRKQYGAITKAEEETL